MRTLLTPAAVVALTIVVSGCAGSSGIQAAADAMGVTTLHSIEYSGSGSQFAFGQAATPGGAWPRFEARVYSVAVDYETPAMRVEMLRAQGEHPPRGGGGQPFAGDQRTIQIVSGSHAWNEGGAQPAPAPATLSDRRRQIWLTPHGVIKAAIASGAAATGNEFTVSIEGRDVRVTLNDENLVELVEYLVSNPVVGDVTVEIIYSDYADYAGVLFPRRIVETQDGFETLDVTVTEVRPNAAVSLDVPAGVAGAPPPAAPVAAVEEVAPGLWSITAANTRSLAIEFADHVVMLEGPTSDARSVAANEALRKVVPSKPIRYVVNTHSHYDHAGGLRAYVAEGVTVITHEANKAFLEEAWARPRTIAPDALSKAPRPATIETVGDRRTLTDGSRVLDLYHLKNSGHHTGTLIAYLPRERILMYGDGYNPPAGDDPRDPTRTAEYGLQLYEAVQEQKLDPARIAPVHGRVVPFDNLRIAIGAGATS